MKTAIVILAMVVSAFAADVPTISSTPDGLASGSVKGQHFGSSKGRVFIQPRLILNEEKRAAGVDEAQARHILSGLEASNRIEVKGVPAWADGEISVSFSAQEIADIQSDVVAKASGKISVPVSAADFVYAYQVERADEESSEWSPK